MQHKEIETIKEEVKKEFQVERMILFSDAVFAIVITLMAIEIKLPHFEKGELTEEAFTSALLHLIPIIFAYAVSFFFIGVIWYRHLKVFAVVKNYDLGLIFRNLLLLFFVGLFPFGASIISGGQIGYLLRISIYFLIIFSCIYSLFFLNRYILITKPELREDDADITELMQHYKKSVPSIIGLPIVFALIVSTYLYIETPEWKSLATLWTLLIPVFQLVYKKFEKKSV